MKATIQIYNDANWYDAAELIFSSPKMSARVTLSYFTDYITNIPKYGIKDCWACSVNAPITIIPTIFKHWPGVLDDLLPAGKSRDWWLRYLDVSRKTEFDQNYALLTHACIAPIGNIRIKEAAEKSQNNGDNRFNIEDVVTLQYSFLEYANEQGSGVGGATGATGAAPKLLLMLENNQVFIDADFAGKPLTAVPYLTKFARNKRSVIDNNILKAEGVYYQALTEILAETNIQTIDIQNMLLKEHDGQVSLWLPRFDIVINNGIADRIGVESVYSIINAGPGSSQEHFDVIDRVWNKIKTSTKMSSSEFVKQYVVRDFLNLIFGNSDNHGRNISFFKYDEDITFAPIYDFAPMKADPEVITRLFKWGRGYEKVGEVRFDLIAKELEHYCEPNELIGLLTHLANKLIELPALLSKLGCPQEIIDLPVIGLKHIKKNLIKMGVYHV